MKPQVYYFGTLPGGFSSYPGDHTRAFFEEFLRRSKKQVQIVIHREDNLLHYGYVRKFGNNFFGICICTDRIHKDTRLLFSILDDIYADMVYKGDILKVNQKIDIEWNIKAYVDEIVALNEYSIKITEQIKFTDSSSITLPPTDFSISINDCLDISLESPNNMIEDAIKRYPNVYVTKTNAEIERLTSLNKILSEKDDKIRNLQREVLDGKNKNDALSRKLTRAKAQQRNLMWVSILGAIALVFGFIIWNKVLFPSEVTHYETEKFIYYGPIKNRLPHGEGVAIYYDNDQDGRKFYFGKFENGIRRDSMAMLYYKNGNFFYGQVEGESLCRGFQYMNTSNAYFRGTYNNKSKPYNGTWYDYHEAYKLFNGKRK